MMEKLDAYVRITCREAAALAEAAIEGIKARRKRRAAVEADAFVARMTRPAGLLRRPAHTESEAREMLRGCGMPLFWDAPEYDYWWALNRLQANELRAADALLSASRGRCKGHYVLVNPEDMAELRSMAM